MIEQVYIKIGTFTATIRLEQPDHILTLKRLTREHLGVEAPESVLEEAIELARAEVRSRERSRGCRFMVHHAEITLDPVEVGDTFQEVINQGMRECEVIDVKKTRYRISFEMPNCTQEGWRKGVTKDGKVYRFSASRGGLAWGQGYRVRRVPTAPSDLLKSEQVYTVECYDRGAIRLKEIPGQMFYSSCFQLVW